MRIVRVHNPKLEDVSASSFITGRRRDWSEYAVLAGERRVHVGSRQKRATLRVALDRNLLAANSDQRSVEKYLGRTRKAICVDRVFNTAERDGARCVKGDVNRHARCVVGRFDAVSLVTRLGRYLGLEVPPYEELGFSALG